jgi:light-regulated signal transduction histidine kinase (bacteriophytochrome)
VEKVVVGRGKLEMENGKPVRMVGNTADITHLKKMQEQLESKIRELNRSNVELEQFAYVASHDLQEPLRKITAFGDRLRSKFATTLGEEGMMYLERMTSATQRMQLLIDNLLNFSRLTRRNQPFVRSDLNQILLTVLSDLDLKIEDKQAVIELEDLPEMEVIPSQISQLFNNLINNSLKFSHLEVLPVVKIKAEKLSGLSRRRLNLDAKHNYWQIQVMDNGIGFEQEYAEKIFIIFQRLYGRSEYEGTGIGLAICKKIVENHGGLISAESSPGNGAVFTIILPENQ